MAGFLDPASALFGAPDLLRSPQLALAASQAADPVSTGQMLAHTSAVVAQSKALEDSASEHGDGFVHQLFGGLGHAIHSVLHVAGEGLHQLAKPLGDVQHDYRYLRDVFSNHGFFAGAAETLAVTVAGGVAGYFGGAAAGAAAAEGVASLEQRLFFKDSADRTRDSSAVGYVRGISPGRDLAHLVGLGDTGHGLGKVVSGLGDATFDFVADPLIIGGKFQAARKSIQGLTGEKAFLRATAADRSNAYTRFVERWAPGRAIELGNPDRVDAARSAYGGYQRALKDIGPLDAGGVVSKYPELAGLAPELGVAKTADEVHEVFRQAAFDTEMNARLTGTALPSRSLLRAPFSAANERLKMLAGEQSVSDQRSLTGALLRPTPSNLKGAVARKVRTFSGYMPYAIDKGELDLSRTTFNPLDTSGLQGMLRVMRFSMGEKAARRWVHEFATAPNRSAKKAIYTEALTDMYKAGGLADDHALIQQVHTLVGGKVAGVATNEAYGHGRHLGAAVSEVTHGGGTDQLGLYAHQKGSFSFPDFFEFKNAIRDMNGFHKQYGKVDDFAAHYYTNGFFKPLALVTLGFGLRVGASELIPATFRYGAAAMLTNAVASAAAKREYRLMHGEDGHILAASAKLVGGMDRLVNSQADRDLALAIVIRNEGHLVKGVASTGENSLALPDDAIERAKATQWYLKQRKGRVAMQADTNSFQALTRDANQYQDYWVAALQRRSQEASGQLIAKDLLELRGAGMAEPDAIRVATERETARIRGDGPSVQQVTPAVPAVPGDEALPAAANLPPLFHGTSKAFAGDALGEKYVNGVSADNLLGPGFYTTDSPTTAAKYTAKGRKALGEGAQPTIYSVRHAKEAPRLLDMDEPLPNNILAHFKAVIDADPQLQDFIAASELDGLTGVDAYAKLRAALSEHSVENQIPKYEIDEILHGLNDSIADAGFDGLKHVGGQIFKQGFHGVRIFFHNQDVNLTRHRLGTPAQPEIRTVVPGQRVLGTERDPYVRERDVLARYTVQEPEEFATHRVDDMANHLTGDNGEFHTDLARMIGAGQKPTRQTLDEIAVEARPSAIVGHDLVPYVGQNLLQRGVQKGFKHLVDPVINHISREPIFFAAVKENYAALSKAVEKGMLTEEEALSRAMYRGSLDMLPQIHNTALRSQFSQLLRNYLPFYFAQEQAIKRTGYLISNHPAALEQYQLIEHGLTDPNFVHTDDQGNRHLMIPLAAGIGGHFLNGAAALGIPVVGGLPLSVSGDMASLKTVLPEIQQPGVTPIAGIALNKIAAIFPEYSPEVKGLVGERGFGRSFQDQLIPNAPLRNLVRGLQGDEADRSFGSAFATALAAASFHGKVPPPDASPAEQQAFLDQVKNNTRSMFFLKTILSAISPLSPTVSQEDPGLLDEFHTLVKDKGGYAAGVQEFIKRHGEKGISYTVAKSETTNGANIPYTNSAINFVNANAALITSGKTQLAAAALVPQEEGPGDIQTIHDEMLRMHLRAKRTPEDFRNALYVQHGNREFFADYAVHKQAIDSLDGNTDAQTAENAAWADHVASLQLANPVWAADFYSPVKAQRARQTLVQLEDLFATGNAPQGSQTDLVRGLLEDYRGHNLALASYGSDRTFGHQRQVERDAWDAYLDQRATEEPRLASVISGVFKQLGRAAT